MAALVGGIVIGYRWSADITKTLAVIFMCVHVLERLRGNDYRYLSKARLSGLITVNTPSRGMATSGMHCTEQAKTLPSKLGNCWVQPSVQTRRRRLNVLSSVASLDERQVSTVLYGTPNS